jgi:glutathione S-transferase
VNGCFVCYEGRQPSLLDLVIWPWFERIPAVTLLRPVCAMNKARFPKLTAWQMVMKKLPAVKACLIDVQSHAVVIRSFADKKPNYGYGLE